MNIINLFRKQFLKSVYSKRLLIKNIPHRKGIIILMYHSITNCDSDYPYCVMKNNFEKQIKFLHDNFKSLSLNETFQYILNSDKHYDKPCFCITFDDGYRDNITIAYPILKKYNIPFSIFLTTNFIDAENSSFLNWNNINELSKDPLITFGAHSVNHINLLALSDNDVEKEIIFSKEKIISRIKKPVDFFAYPSGGYNEKIKEIIKIHFKGGLKDRLEIVDDADPFALPRISIDKTNEQLKEFIYTLASSRFLS